MSALQQLCKEHCNTLFGKHMEHFPLAIILSWTKNSCNPSSRKLLKENRPYFVSRAKGGTLVFGFLLFFKKGSEYFMLIA